MSADPLPLVTIGIPTYNRADSFFPETLRSALRQQYANIEIIVSDNASTDSTAAVVEQFADERVRYFQQPQVISPNANANFCLQHASGHYFVRLHDDDLIDPDFVSTCVAASKGRTDVGLIRTGVRVVDEAGKVISQKENRVSGTGTTGLFQAWFRGETTMYLPSTMFNTEALKELGGFSSRQNLFDDVVAMVRIASRMDRVDILHAKASFRRHGSNFGVDPRRVMSWADDCIYLRDLLVATSPPETKETIYREASMFLCAKAYRQTGFVDGRIARLAARLRIYARFGFRYFPPELRPIRLLSRVLRKLKGTLARWN